MVIRKSEELLKLEAFIYGLSNTVFNDCAAWADFVFFNDFQILILTNYITKKSCAVRYSATGFMMYLDCVAYLNRNDLTQLNHIKPQIEVSITEANWTVYKWLSSYSELSI